MQIAGVEWRALKNLRLVQSCRGEFGMTNRRQEQCGQAIAWVGGGVLGRVSLTANVCAPHEQVLDDSRRFRHDVAPGVCG